MLAQILWTSITCSPASPPERPSAPVNADVIAIGDLHGDLDNALAVLRQSKVVDAEGRWAAGDATLVQTGDITDRGPDSRALIALLRRLGTEAEVAGGRVVALLGNHEVMNLQGDWRYVHPGDVAAYGTVEARREALSAAGADGAWLRARPAAAKVGDTVFVHGGISPSFAAWGVDGLNAEVHRALRDRSPSEVLGPDGPLWYRGYVQDPEAVACANLTSALVHLDAKRMVVGHTTRRDGRLQPRCDGRLVVIDVGIADAYGGHLGAWELSGTDSGARYATGLVDLPDP